MNEKNEYNLFVPYLDLGSEHNKIITETLSLNNYESTEYIKYI